MAAREVKFRNQIFLPAQEVSSLITTSENKRKIFVYSLRLVCISKVLRATIGVDFLVRIYVPW